MPCHQARRDAHGLSRDLATGRVTRPQTISSVSSFVCFLVLPFSILYQTKVKFSSNSEKIFPNLHTPIFRKRAPGISLHHSTSNRVGFAAARRSDSGYARYATIRTICAIRHNDIDLARPVPTVFPLLARAKKNHFVALWHRHL